MKKYNIIYADPLGALGTGCEVPKNSITEKCIFVNLVCEQGEREVKTGQTICHWLPVSVKPKRKGWYLAWWRGQKNLSVAVVYWDPKNNPLTHGWISEQITHWAELPKNKPI